MIRIIHSHDVVVGPQCTYYEFSGLKDDEKPTTGNICTGSRFLEVDTGEVYAFDEEDAQWHKIRPDEYVFDGGDSSNT